MPPSSQAAQVPITAEQVQPSKTRDESQAPVRSGGVRKRKTRTWLFAPLAVGAIIAILNLVDKVGNDTLQIVEENLTYSTTSELHEEVVVDKLVVEIPAVDSAVVGVDSTREDDSFPQNPQAEATDRFAKSGNIITDHETGLEWRVSPDENIDWYEACAWIDGLGGGWQMPTRSELRDLHGAGITSDDWDVFENCGWSYVVWSADERDSSSAWTFTVTDGYEHWEYLSGGGPMAVAFRSR